jgi:hypothetical protein
MFASTSKDNLQEDAKHLLVDQHCITWVKGVIQDKLSKSRDLSVQWTSENQKTVAEFLLHDENYLLFVYVQNNHYITSASYESAKKCTWDHLLFFLKDTSDEEISLDTISSIMSYGLLTKELLGDFLNLMKNYFAPDLIESKTNWPESKLFLFTNIRNKIYAI